MRIFKVVTLLALVVSCLVTVGVLLQMANWRIEFGMLPFGAWALSPYLSFFAASWLLEKYSKNSYLSPMFSVVSILILGFTVWAYLGASDSNSSTESLVFIFAPIYLYLGSSILTLVAIAAGLIMARRTT